MTTPLPGSPASLDRPSSPRQARAHALAATTHLKHAVESAERFDTLTPDQELTVALVHALLSIAYTELQPPRRSVRQVDLTPPRAYEGVTA